MFRSKVETHSKLFTLDADVLFFILTLLPTLKDAVSAVSVNKILRTFFFSRYFWQHQLRRDLYLKAPPGTRNVGLFYQQRLSLLASERKLTVTYLGAYRFVMSIGGITKPVKMGRVAQLRQLLVSGTNSMFYDLVLRPIYHRLPAASLPYSEENLLWKQVMQKEGANNAITADKLLPLCLLPDKASREFCHSVSLFLVILAITNSHTTIYQLLHQLSPEKKQMLLNRIGADMLCQATIMGHLATVKLLLEEGVNPNHYGLYLDPGEENNVRRLLALPLYFLHLLQKQKESIIKKNSVMTEMAKLLLQHGANVDLPATQEVGVTAEENAARQSVREVTRLYLAETEANHAKYKKLEFTLLQKSIKTISQAPELTLVDENSRLNLGR